MHIYLRYMSTDFRCFPTLSLLRRDKKRSFTLRWPRNPHILRSPTHELLKPVLPTTVHQPCDHIPSRTHAVIEPNTRIAIPSNPQPALVPLQHATAVLHALVVAHGVLRDAVPLQAHKHAGRFLRDTQMPAQHVQRHDGAVALGRDHHGRVGPPMPAHHDGHLGAGHGVLPGRDVGVEHHAEGAFWVLAEGDGARDQVAESVLGQDVRFGEIHVHDHHGNRWREAEGWDVGHLVQVDSGGCGYYMGKVGCGNKAAAVDGDIDLWDTQVSWNGIYIEDGIA